MSRVVIVVPCYNEAQRLDTAAFCDWLLRQSDVSMIFVNDGSRDRTLEVLSAMHLQLPDRVELLDMPKNEGKAEAVRRGLLRALEHKPDRVGYLDADLATPLCEVERLILVSERANVQLVLGSRVALLGRHIERSRLRHYVGRVFATAASLTLALRVYDTQCGAKILRPSPTLDAALATPFLSRWAFDVELIGRLLNPPRGTPALGVEEIFEEPLNQWRDVPGSKLNPMHMIHAALDLARIALDLRRHRGQRRA
jgi:dolichyl-phosphate beta-glucosyltransferase